MTELLLFTIAVQHTHTYVCLSLIMFSVIHKNTSDYIEHSSKIKNSQNRRRTKKKQTKQKKRSQNINWKAKKNSNNRRKSKLYDWALTFGYCLHCMFFFSFFSFSLAVPLSVCLFSIHAYLPILYIHMNNIQIYKIPIDFVR